MHNMQPREGGVMNILRDVAIGKRCYAGFGLFIGIIIVICALGFKNMADIDGQTQTIAKMAADKDFSADKITGTIKAMNEGNDKVRVSLVVVCLLSVGVGIAVSLVLTKSITNAISHSTMIMEKLANGELAVDTGRHRGDEFGKEKEALRLMASKFSEVIGSVKKAADTLAQAGHELSAGAEQMSRSSDGQAERAALVAASSEEMSQTVVEVARSANGISQSATQTAKTAREGEAIVGRAVTEVREIAATVNGSAELIQSLGERSHQIGEIVGVINDIADQTNLLALNAAIEAARAGEQGRGFAVVADEVRKLAERTAHATAEISTMIKAIQNEVGKAVGAMSEATGKVDSGVRLSNEAGQALHNIVKSVDDLQLMVQQIASAADEMSATSDQISKDIESIAQLSKESSANSDQTAASSREMTRLSANLQDLIGDFHL
jgi:methyl-accepting chemotaxis protein